MDHSTDKPLNTDKPAVHGTIERSEWLEFRCSPIHGTGGFARKDIPAGTRLIEYVGEKITKEESLQRCEANNEYIFTLDDQTDIDGNVAWNPARFINHSCEPNCDAELIDSHIYVVARRDIQSGEEVSFNYGYDLTDYKDYPCRCGSRNCVGFIVAEEYFSHVRQRYGKKEPAEGFQQGGRTG